MNKNDIRLQYRKSMNHNYLVADMPDGAEDDYRLEMISRNNIPGLLKALRRMNEGREQVYYEISSLQPLSRIYDHKEIKKSDASILLRGIIDVFRAIQEYMLTEGALILDPEYLYVDPESLKPGLLYIPWSGKQMQERLLELTEYLMEHIDQNDPASAMWTYRLYKIAKNENFVLDDIERILIDQAAPEPDTGYRIMEKECFGETAVIPSAEVTEVYEEEEEDNERRQGLFTRIFGSGAKDKEKKAEKKASKKDSKKKPHMTRREDKENEEETESFEMPDFSDAFSDMEPVKKEDEDYGKTVFIGQTDTKPENILVEKNKGKQYRINSFPFTIGKVKNCVDLPLTDNSVSRIHARLFMQNGRVYLQDCHSTNGTFINGVQLEAEEQVMLEKEDEIGIGRVRFSYM